MIKLKLEVKFFLLFFLTVLIMYYTTPSIHLLYCGILLFIYFRSTDDPFWFVFFMSLIFAPGLLFNTNDIGHNWRIVTIGSRWILFSEFVFLIIIIKSLTTGLTRVKYFYFKYIYILMLFAGILLLYGYHEGMAGSKILKVVREAFPFFLFFAIPRLFSSLEHYKRFFRLLAVYIIFVLAVQVFELIFGNSFASLFGGTSNRSLGDLEEETARQVYATLPIILGVIGILYFKLIDQKLYIGLTDDMIIAAGFISLTLNATRGYWLALVVLLICYFIFFGLKGFKIGIASGVVFLLSYFLLTRVSLIGIQINNAVTRLSTLELLSKGDITAGGTLQRITERAPRVLEQFWARPLFGWGFSDHFFEYTDIHVSHASVLMNSGIVGYSLWVVFWISFIYINMKSYLKFGVQNPWRQILLLGIFGFLAFFIAGSTSTTIFSYLIGIHAFYLSIFYGLFGYSLEEGEKLNNLDIENSKKRSVIISA